MLRVRVGDLLALSKSSVLDRDSWFMLLSCIRNFAINLQISKEKKLYCTRISDAISAHFLRSNVAPFISYVQDYVNHPCGMETKLVEQIASHATVLVNEKNLDCKVIIPTEIVTIVHNTWHRIPSRSDTSIAGILIHLALMSANKEDSHFAQAELEQNDDHSQADESMNIDLSKEELIARLQNLLLEDDSGALRQTIRLIIAGPQSDSWTQHEKVHIFSRTTSTENISNENIVSEDIIFAWSLVNIRRWLLASVADFKAYSQPNTYVELLTKTYSLKELISLFFDETRALMKIGEPLRALSLLSVRYTVSDLWAEKLRNFPLETHIENTARIIEQVELANKLMEEESGGSLVVGGNIFRAKPDNIMKNISVEFSAIAQSMAQLLRDILDNDVLNADISRILENILKITSVSSNVRLATVITELIHHLQEEDETSRLMVIKMKETLKSLLTNETDSLQWDNEIFSAQNSPLRINEESFAYFNETDHLSQKLIEAKETHNNLVAEKHDLVLKLEQREENEKKLRALINDLEFQLLRSTLSAENLEKELKNQKSELNNLTRELQYEKSNSSKLENDLRDANKTTKNFERELDDCRKKLESALQELSEKSFSADYSDKETENVSPELSRTTHLIEHELKECREEKNALQAEVENLKVLLDTNEQEVEMENRKYAAKIAELSSGLVSRDDEIKYYKAEMEKKDNKHIDLKEEHRLLEQSFADKSSKDHDEIKDLRSELERTKKKLFTLENNKERYRTSPQLKRARRRVCKHCDVMRRLHNAVFSKRTPTGPSSGKRQRSQEILDETDNTVFPNPKRRFLDSDDDDTFMSDETSHFSAGSSPSLHDVLRDSAELAGDVASAQIAEESETDMFLMAENISSLNAEQLQQLSRATRKLELICQRESNETESRSSPAPKQVDEKLMKLWGPPFRLLFKSENVMPHELTHFFNDMKLQISRRGQELEAEIHPASTS